MVQVSASASKTTATTTHHVPCRCQHHSGWNFLSPLTAQETSPRRFLHSYCTLPALLLLPAVPSSENRDRFSSRSRRICMVGRIVVVGSDRRKCMDTGYCELCARAGGPSERNKKGSADPHYHRDSKELRGMPERRRKRAPYQFRPLHSTKLLSSSVCVCVCQSRSLPLRLFSFLLNFSCRFHVGPTHRFICKTSSGRAWQLLFLAVSCAPDPSLTTVGLGTVGLVSRNALGKFRGLGSGKSSGKSVDDASAGTLNGPHCACHSDASLLHCCASSGSRL